MTPTSTNGLKRSSKISNAANHSLGTKSQSSKGKSKAPNAETQCDLCNKKFGNVHSLRMHVRMSSVHKTSCQSKSSASEATVPSTAAIADQNLVTTTAPVLSEQRETASTVFQCELYKHSRKEKKDLERHKRWSTQHMTTASKTAKNGQVSRTNRETNSTSLAQTPLVHIPPGTKGTSSARQQQFYCITCNRHFQTPNGFQRHVETSREHKAKLRQSTTSTSSNSSEQYMSVLTSPKAPDSNLQVQVESMRITESSNGPAAATISSTNLVSFTAGSNTAPVQMSDPIHPPTKQDRFVISPLLTGEEWARAAQVSNTAYPFNGCWSNVPVHDQQLILEVLREKCHPVKHLSMNGYFIRPLTAEEVDGTRKCNSCGGIDPMLLFPQRYNNADNASSCEETIDQTFRFNMPIPSGETRL